MRAFISRAALFVKVTAEYLARACATDGQDVRDARGEHAGLSGSGAGEHEDRSIERLDSKSLFRVEIMQDRTAPRRPRARGNSARLWRRRYKVLELAGIGHPFVQIPLVHDRPATWPARCTSKSVLKMALQACK